MVETKRFDARVLEPTVKQTSIALVFHGVPWQRSKQMSGKEKMTLRGRFHDSLFSCFSSSPASPPSPPPLPSSPRPSGSPPPEEQEEKKQDEDSSREVNIPAPSDPELTRWLRATQAAQLRSHRPTKADVPSPWAYAKEVEQVCTLEPFTCERVTLFLRSTLSGPDMARKLYDDFFSALEVTFKDISEGDKESSYPVDPTITHIINEDGHPILMVETAPGEHMYGPTLMLTSNNIESLEALEYLDSIFPEGYSCLIYHEALAVTMETVVGTMRLICRSGIGSTQLSAKHMATIFEVEAEGAPRVHCGRHLGIAPKVVARCVLGYRDASVWQSVGPTIQTLMIRTDYQGNGLVQELFNAVEKWFADTWTLDTRYRNRALKVTHLRDFIVDRAPRKKDDPVDSFNELTDKMFFYEMMHFVCNNPYPADPRVKIQDDLPEAHAIRFYPPTGTPTNLPSVLYSKPYLVKGWRSCDFCRLTEEVPGRLEVCSNCNAADYYWRAHYCNRACQVKDWAVHRLWCGKTFDQFMDARKTFEESRRNVGTSTPNQVDSRDDTDEPQNIPT